MSQRFADFDRQRSDLLQGGGPARTERQLQQGSLTARERLALLFDPDSFVASGLFARGPASEREGRVYPAEGVVAGKGWVRGRQVCGFAQDVTVAGGSVGHVHAAKICECLRTALKCGLPVVGFNDSGGARIQEGVEALSGYGQIFYMNTLLSGVDVPGFLPGVEQEHGGIIRHGAKMLFAWSAATVAKMTVILRKAYGGAYLAMCSKDLGADSVLAWPTAEIAVMGPEGAAEILNRKELDASSDRNALLRERAAEYRRLHADPFRAAAILSIDEVIRPSWTRRLLIERLALLRAKRDLRRQKEHGKIPM